MPLVTRPGPPAPELVGIHLSEFPTPLPDRLVSHNHSAGEEQLFDVAVAKAKAVVQPDTMTDDLSREAVVFVPVGWCGGIHSSSKTVYRYAESAFLSREAILRDEYTTPC